MRSRQPSTRHRFVYVGTYTEGTGARGVDIFAMDAEGELTHLQTAADIPNPSWLTIDHGQRFLYATSEVDRWHGHSGGGATSLEIDPTSGVLTKKNDQPTVGIAVSAIVDGSGNYLVTANYAGASYTTLPILEDGRLGPATGVRRVSGRGPRQLEPHPHDIRLDPSGRLVFGVDLGTDTMWAWEIARGQLVPHDPPYAQVTSGAGPRQLTFHPSGHTAYVVNELSSSITVFRYDGARGAFTRIQEIRTVPPEFTGENFPAAVAIHPEGRFLYCSNRGHDSIATFTVDSRNGMLDPIGSEPTRGRNPRHFAIDPSSQFLLVANQDSDTIVAFRIQRATGELEHTGAVTRTPKPACVVFASGFPAARGGPGREPGRRRSSSTG